MKAKYLSREKNLIAKFMQKIQFYEKIIQYFDNYLDKSQKENSAVENFELWEHFAESKEEVSKVDKFNFL